MKRPAKMTCILLALAMLASTAACGGSSTTASSASSGGGSASSAASADPAASQSKSASSDAAPIKWLTTGDAAAKPVTQGDRIVATINEKIGIDLSVQIVPEGNVEKVNVAMASGDFPDVVTGQYGTSATQSWIDNGMVIELNPYFGDNPALKAWNETDYPWTATDGKFYGVPFITQYKTANALIVMRQDWLDKLGLQYPQTLEEMKNVLTAFTNDDPDGNGQKDTFGFTAEKPKDGSTPFDWVFFAYGNEYADYALDGSGNVIPWFEGGSFIPGMTYIKDLWDSGLIDNELMLNDNPKKEEKFYQGRAGAMLAPLFRHVSRHESSVQQIFPEATISYGLPPKGPDGKFGLSKQGKGGMYTCVTAACKAPDKAASFINFMLSGEGNELLRLGIEGTHYTKDGDKVVFSEEERAKDSFAENGWAHALAWGSFFWPLESGYLPDTEPMRERALETTTLASEAQVPNLIKQKTPMEIKNLSALNDIYTQYFSDMLQGKISIEEGARQLSEKWRSQGGEEVLAEVNTVYQASK